jgi:hypothetical protein
MSMSIESAFVPTERATLPQVHEAGAPMEERTTGRTGAGTILGQCARDVASYQVISRDNKSLLQLGTRLAYR